MFAVLKTGGKQYKVQSGDTLRVEKLAADAGEKVQFNDILMIGGEAMTIGAPFVDGAAVQAEVLEQIKGDKVIHFVRRRRKHSSKRTKGHRQHLTLLRVTDILDSGAADTGVKAAIGAGSVPAAAAPVAKAPAKAKAAAPKADTAPKAAEETAPATSSNFPVSARHWKRSCWPLASRPLPRSRPGPRRISPNLTKNCLSRAGSNVKAGSNRPKSWPRVKEKRNGT